MTTSEGTEAVLDIDYMLTRESPLAIELVEKLEARVEAARIVNETTKVRKALDGEILQLLEDYDLGEIHYNGEAFKRNVVKGRMNWDSDYLQRVLSPEQLEDARKQGKGYTNLLVGKAKK